MSHDLAKLAPEMDGLKRDTSSALAVVKALPTETPADMALLNDVLVQVRDQTKAVTARRAEILDPLNSSIKAIKALFSPVLDTLGEIEQSIRDKVSSKALAQLQADTQARAAATQAAKAGNTQAVSVALAQVSTGARVELGNLAVTWSWEGEIEDFDQIPREWLTLDRSKVKMHCQAHAKSEAIPPVPGLKFTRTAGTRAKA